MARRIHPSAVIAAASILLAVVVTLTLADANSSLLAALILGLVLIAGAAVGAGTAARFHR